MSVSLDINPCSELKLVLPVYGTTGKYKVADDTGNGVGDIRIELHDHLIKSIDFKVLGSDSAWVDTMAGLGIPLDGEYSSAGEVLTLGGELGLAWGRTKLSHTIRYSFVDEYTYVPGLGGFVNGNNYFGSTRLSFQPYDRVDLFVKLDQYMGDGMENIYVGPGVKCKLFSGCSVFGEVGMPFGGDFKGGSPDLNASMGIQLEF